MNALRDKIKLSLLTPSAQLLRMDAGGFPLESDDVLFPISALQGESVFKRIPFPSQLSSEISALDEGGVLWRRGISVALPGREGVFDFAFTREGADFYWLVVDLSHAWNGNILERWQETAEKPAEREAGAPLRILLAEDNPFNQRVTLRQLARLGFEAEAVGNGQEVLQALSDRHFDLVLMDLNMPVMNGYDAFVEIRTLLPAPRSKTPVVALSSSGLSAHDPGFDAVLKKPVQSELLNRTILSLVAKAEPGLEGTVDGPLVRLDYLREVTQDNREMMVELMDIYLHEVPQALAGMRTHLETGEWRALRELAHKTKANFRYVGADRMFALADTIERYAASGRMVDQIPELMAKLMELAEPTAISLRQERDNLPEQEPRS